MSDDTRKDQRVKVQTLKAKYKSATIDEFIEQYAGDISQGGIFIKTPKPAANGTLLKIEIQLRDASPVISAVGRVVWRRETAQGSEPAGMGIKFIKVEDPSQAVINRIVAAKGENSGPRFDSIPPPAAETAGPAAGQTNSEFFGQTNPAAEMPPEQDRTMMRQMSAFLGEALRSTTEEPAKPAAPASPASKPVHKATIVGMPSVKPSAPGAATPAAKPAVPATPAAPAKPAAPAAPTAAAAPPGGPLRKGTMIGMAAPAPSAAAIVAKPVTSPAKPEHPEFADDDSEVPTTVSSKDDVDRLLKKLDLGAAEEAAKADASAAATAAAATSAADGEQGEEVSTQVADRSELDKLIKQSEQVEAAKETAATAPAEKPAAGAIPAATAAAAAATAATATSEAEAEAASAPEHQRAERTHRETGREAGSEGG